MDEKGNKHGGSGGLHRRVLWRGRAVFVADPDSPIAQVLAQHAQDHPEQVTTLTEREMGELAAAPELPPTPVPITWQKALRQVRREQDLSLTALCKKSGVAYRTLSMVERGERLPNWRTVRKLSEALGVHPDEIKEFAEARQAEAERAGFDAPFPASLVTAGKTEEA